MRVTHVLLVVAVTVFPSLVRAQIEDSLRVGDRVRVRVAATRGNTNLFVGNVASISPDTLILDIPGGKGTIILPRAAIAEVAIANGRESRFRNLPQMAPMLVAPIMLATLPTSNRGLHSNAARNWKYVLVATTALPFVPLLMRTPPERWSPVYSWLDRRSAP